MKDATELVWPEDGVGAEKVLTATAEMLGAHQWLAFVPNPRPHKHVCDKITEKIGGSTFPMNNYVVFVIDGASSANALRTFFEAGLPEWAVLGFARPPDGEMIATALQATDAKPASRLLMVDSNSVVLRL